MKKHFSEIDFSIPTLNKIYINVLKLNQNLNTLIELACKAKNTLNSTGTVSPIIQNFKPQNQCSEQPKKKSKDAIEV